MPTDRKKQKSENRLEGPVTQVPVELPSRHVFVKCPSCHRVCDEDVLSENLDVCPRCGYPMRVGARRRLAMTVDAGSFEETDADLMGTDFLQFPGYADKLRRARVRTGENDAVITGVGSIGGCPTAIFVMDGEFMMGSMGVVVGEKICRLFETATKLQIPVVGFTVSGGARMQEGVTSLMQMAKISAAVRRHSEAGLLYIVVLTDPTSGGVTASFAMEGDITLAEPGALVAFAGPRVVEQTTHKRLPQGFQRSEFLLEHGFVDRIVERKDLPAMLAMLLAFHDVKPFLAPDASTHPELLAHEPEPVPEAKPEPGKPAFAVPVPMGVGKREPLSSAITNLAELAANDVLPGALGKFAKQTMQGQKADQPKDDQKAKKDEQEQQPVDSSQLSAYERLERVRSAERQTVLPLIRQTFDGFLELHGDRYFGDDEAVVAGLALLGRRPVTVVGTERGQDTKERIARNFGSANPEGYRKSLRLMEEAQKFDRPVICLVDTSGAYCGIGAEERGQGEAIASNLVALSGLRVPVVTVVVGEGGSGGALALAVADRVLMLSGAVYSVVSPEGAASILWKDTSRAPEAADALHITADDLVQLGIVDGVVDDTGLGTKEFAHRLAGVLEQQIDELSKLDVDELVQKRYERFRRMGVDKLC